MGKKPIFNELNNEQRLRLIDIQQTADSLRDDAFRLRHEFHGSMTWKARNGQDYLYRREGRVEKSLGRRSPETEAIFQTFQRRKNILLERRSGTGAVLWGWAPVTRALRLGRVPLQIARLLRRLDAAELLGDRIQIAGGCALLAYEAMTGLVFDTETIGSLSGIEIVTELRPKALLGYLRSIDLSFGQVESDRVRFLNAAGLSVDVIGHEVGDHWRGVHAIGADGMPVWIAAVHPSHFVTSAGTASSPKRIEAISYMLAELWYEGPI